MKRGDLIAGWEYRPRHRPTLHYEVRARAASRSAAVLLPQVVD